MENEKITRIENDINALERMNGIAKEAKLSTYELTKNISLLKGEKELLLYWREKTKTDVIELGKYFKFYLEYTKPRLDCWFSLTDREMQNRLYDLVFESYSGIQEFMESIFLPLLSSMAGFTDFSHAFGSYDVTSSIRQLSGFYDNFYGKNEDEIAKGIAMLKRDIDAVCTFASDKDIAQCADKLFEDYASKMLYLYNMRKAKEETL